MDNKKESGDSGQDQDEKSGKDGKDKEDKPRSKWPLIALGIAVVIALIGAAIYWFMTKDLQDTDDAYTDGRAVLISPKVGGYVTQLAVNDNQFVHQGDLLVQIEQRDYLAARDQAAGQVIAVAAQLDAARVARDKAGTTYPAQLKQAQGQLLEAKGRLFQAQREYERQNNIDHDATTQQTIDGANASFKIAQGQAEEAEAQVQQASLVRQNLEQADAQVRQLEGQLLQQKAALAAAELDLSYTSIVAPHDGWISRRNVEIGTFLQPGTMILAVVEPEIWITANFKEEELRRMRPGQRVGIRVDAYPNLKLEGHVDSLQSGSGSRFSAFPAENATGNFVKIVQRVPVKIVIDRGLPPDAPPLALGLSVTPTVYFK
jgi:membrane fusion protein (multidrug efflux system)